MHEAPYIRGLGDEIYSLCYPSILNLVNIGSVRPMNIHCSRTTDVNELGPSAMLHLCYCVKQVTFHIICENDSCLVYFVCFYIVCILL